MYFKMKRLHLALCAALSATGGWAASAASGPGERWAPELDRADISVTVTTDFGDTATVLYQLDSYRGAPPIFNNGPLATGVSTESGQPAPTDFEWSEVQHDTGVLTHSNGFAGFTVTTSDDVAWRLADDFTVPTGETWTLEAVRFFAYLTGHSSTTTPFVQHSLQIWDGPPGQGGSTVLCGDETSNQLVDSSATHLYRIFNSVVPAPGFIPGTTRRVWANTVLVPEGCSGEGFFTAGTYWLDWNSTTTSGSTHFAPSVTVVGVRGRPTDNALQRGAGSAWLNALDFGNPNTTPGVIQDFPFLLFGPVQSDVIFVNGFESP